EGQRREAGRGGAHPYYDHPYYDHTWYHDDSCHHDRRRRAARGNAGRPARAATGRRRAGAVATRAGEAGPTGASRGAQGRRGGVPQARRRAEGRRVSLAALEGPRRPRQSQRRATAGNFYQERASIPRARDAGPEVPAEAGEEAERSTAEDGGGADHSHRTAGGADQRD